MIHDTLNETYFEYLDIDTTFNVTVNEYTESLSCPGISLISLSIDNINVGEFYRAGFELYSPNYTGVSLTESGLSNFISNNSLQNFNTNVNITSGSGIFVVKFSITRLLTDITHNQHFIFRCS